MVLVYDWTRLDFMTIWQRQNYIHNQVVHQISISFASSESFISMPFSICKCKTKNGENMKIWWFWFWFENKQLMYWIQYQWQQSNRTYAWQRRDLLSSKVFGLHSTLFSYSRRKNTQKDILALNLWPTQESWQETRNRHRKDRRRAPKPTYRHRQQASSYCFLRWGSWH